jgi:broad-specificity NMP kinase
MTQEEADKLYFRLRIKGATPDKITEHYNAKAEGCSITKSRHEAEKIFRQTAEQQHAVVVGEAMIKLQYAHAKAESDGDLNSEISAALKIVDVHRRYGEDKENKESGGNPWSRGES